MAENDRAYCQLCGRHDAGDCFVHVREKLGFRRYGWVYLKCRCCRRCRYKMNATNSWGCLGPILGAVGCSAALALGVSLLDNTSLERSDWAIILNLLVFCILLLVGVFVFLIGFALKAVFVDRMTSKLSNSVTVGAHSFMLARKSPKKQTDYVDVREAIEEQKEDERQGAWFTEAGR